MSRKKLAWANKEVETFVCILGEEDVVYEVYVAAAAIDIRPTTKGTVGSGNATSELSWANRSLPTAPLRSDPFRTLQWKCGISVCGPPARGWCIPSMVQGGSTGLNRTSRASQPAEKQEGPQLLLDPGNKRPGVNQKHCAATMGLLATALWTDTNTKQLKGVASGGSPLGSHTHQRMGQCAAAGKLPSPDPFSLLPPHSAMKTLLSPLSSSGLTLTSDLSTGSLTPLAPWWSDSVLTEPTNG
ncbi:unnamed protein product [Boreogadus saida]